MYLSFFHLPIRKWSQEAVNAVAGVSVAYKHRSTAEKNPILFESVPMPRHLGSVVLMGLKGSPSRAVGVSRPAVYLFGGYDGVRFWCWSFFL